MDLSRFSTDELRQLREGLNSNDLSAVPTETLRKYQRARDNVPEPEPPGFVGDLIGRGDVGIQRMQQGLYGTLGEIGAISDETAAKGIARNYLEELEARKGTDPAVTEGIMTIGQSEGPWETVQNIAMNPRATLGVVAESLPASGVVMGTGAVGGALGSIAGPAGSLPGWLAGMGLGSYGIEYGYSLNEQMMEAGYDPTDWQDVQKFFTDPDEMEKAREHAKARALPIAVLDMIAAGVAGKAYNALNRTTSGVARRGAGSAAEAGIQALAGGGGEALAGLSTDGIRWGEVGLEAVAEIPTALPEAFMNTAFGPEGAADAQLRRSRAAGVEAEEAKRQHRFASQSLAQYGGVVGDDQPGIAGLLPYYEPTPGVMERMEGREQARAERPVDTRYFPQYEPERGMTPGSRLKNKGTAAKHQKKYPTADLYGYAKDDPNAPRVDEEVYNQVVQRLDNDGEFSRAAVEQEVLRARNVSEETPLSDADKSQVDSLVHALAARGQIIDRTGRADQALANRENFTKATKDSDFKTSEVVGQRRHATKLPDNTRRVFVAKPVAVATKKTGAKYALDIEGTPSKSRFDTVREARDEAARISAQRGGVEPRVIQVEDRVAIAERAMDDEGRIVGEIVHETYPLEAVKKLIGGRQYGETTVFERANDLQQVRERLVGKVEPEKPTPGKGQAEYTQSPRYRAVSERVQAITKKYGLSDRVSVAIRNVITSDDGTNDVAALAVEGFEEGVGEPGKRKIVLATDIYDPSLSPEQVADRVAKVLDHEIVHSYRGLGLINPNEWKVLSRLAGKRKNKNNVTYAEWAADAYPNLSEEEQTEEAIAEMNRDWVEKPSRFSGKPASIFRRMNDFIAKLGSVLRGEGFQNSEDIFRSMRDGTMASRFLGEQPTPNIRRQSRRASNELLPTQKFFSQALEAARVANVEKAKGKDWINIFTKAPGVKAAELEWIGLNDWLYGMQNVTLERDRVVDFINRQQIRMFELMLPPTGGEIPAFKIDTVEALEPDWDIEAQNHIDEIRESNPDASEEEILDMAHDMARNLFEPTEYKVYMHDLNGLGGSYEGTLDVDNGDYSFPDLNYVGDEWGAIEAAGEEAAKFYAEYEDHVQNLGAGTDETNYREYLLTIPYLHEAGPNKDKAGLKAFDKSHHPAWPNVIVHVRVTDRKFNNKRYLFVEEVQSDINKHIRAVNQRPAIEAKLEELRALEQEKQKEIDAIGEKVYNAIREVRTINPDELAEHRELGRQQNQLRDQIAQLEAALDRIPKQAVEQPFGNDNIDRLATKFFIKEAAAVGRYGEGAYDGVAWTPAYQQARTNRKLTYDKVQWRTREDGSKELSLDDNASYGAGSLFYLDQNGEVTGDTKLGDLLPKELAERVRREESGEVNLRVPRSAENSGYRAVYDLRVKKEVDRLLKPYRIRSRLEDSTTLESRLMNELDHGQGVVRRFMTALDRVGFKTEQEIQAQTKELFDLTVDLNPDLDHAELRHVIRRTIAQLSDDQKETLVEEMNLKAGNPVWMVDFTPEAREGIARNKLPMFSRRAAFANTAQTQRGEPEQRMLDVTMYHGGGVINPVVEHVGDLTHRMAQWGERDRFGLEYVTEKVNRGLKYLQFPYGFAKEHNENIINNAKALGRSPEEHAKELDKRLKAYADAHRKVPVWNTAQYAAKQAAIALGEQNWPRAINYLTFLKNMIDLGVYEDRARQFDMNFEEKMASRNKRKLSVRSQGKPIKLEMTADMFPFDPRESSPNFEEGFLKELSDAVYSSMYEIPPDVEAMLDQNIDAPMDVDAQYLHITLRSADGQYEGWITGATSPDGNFFYVGDVEFVDVKRLRDYRDMGVTVDSSGPDFTQMTTQQIEEYYENAPNIMNMRNRAKDRGSLWEDIFHVLGVGDAKKIMAGIRAFTPAKFLVGWPVRDSRPRPGRVTSSFIDISNFDAPHFRPIARTTAELDGETVELDVFDDGEETVELEIEGQRALSGYAVTRVGGQKQLERAIIRDQAFEILTKHPRRYGPRARIEYLPDGRSMNLMDARGRGIRLDPEDPKHRQLAKPLLASFAAVGVNPYTGTVDRGLAIFKKRDGAFADAPVPMTGDAHPYTLFELRDPVDSPEGFMLWGGMSDAEVGQSIADMFDGRTPAEVIDEILAELPVMKTHAPGITAGNPEFRTIHDSLNFLYQWALNHAPEAFGPKPKVEPIPWSEIKGRKFSQRGRTLTVEEAETMNKVAGVGRDMTPIDYAKETATDWSTALFGKVTKDEPWYKALRRDVVNRFSRAFDMDRQIAEVRGYDHDIASLGAASIGVGLENAMQFMGRMELLMEQGGLYYDPEEGVVLPLEGTKGLLEIFGRIGEVHKKDWQTYAAMRRELELRNDPDNPRTGFMNVSDAEAQSYIDNAPDFFGQVFDDYQAFNNNMLKLALDTGLIDQEGYNKFADMSYLPFYRVMEEDFITTPEETLGPKMRQTMNNPKSALNLKKSKEGSTAHLGDLYENLARNTQSILQASLKNLALKQAARGIDELNGAGITDFGRRLPTVGFQSQHKMIFRENGKAVAYEITDPAFWTAISSLKPQQSHPLINLAARFSALLRYGVTLAVGFMAANLLRGKVSAFVTTDMGIEGLNPISTALGAWDAYRNGLDTSVIKSVTGIGGYTYGMGETPFHKEFSRRMRRSTGGGPLWQQAKDRFIGVVKAMERFGEASELAERVVLYRTLRKRDVGRARASYEASNLINFSRHGAGNGYLGWMVQGLIPMVPFLNARIQGLYRIGENQRGRKRLIGLPSSVLVRGLLVSAGSVALYALGNEDDRWDDEALERKISNDIIYLKDKTIYLPRAFEVGSMFGTFPVMLLDAIKKEHGQEFVDGFTATVLNTFAFNPIPQMALPAVEVASNYNFWTTAPLEDQYQKAKMPERRFDTFTSQVAMQISEKTGGVLSPIQIDHLITGYLGTLAESALATMDAGLAASGAFPEKPAGVFGPPVSGPGIAALATNMNRFAKLDFERASQSLRDFYEHKNNASQIYRSLKEAAEIGDLEKARELMEENRVPLATRKAFNAIGRKITEVNALMRTVELNHQLSSREKTEKLQKLVKIKRRLTAQANRIIQRFDL